MEQARQLGTAFGGRRGRIGSLVVLQKGARFGKRPLQLHCTVYWGRLCFGSSAGDDAVCFTGGFAKPFGALQFDRNVAVAPDEIVERVDVELVSGPQARIGQKLGDLDLAGLIRNA